MTMVSCWFRLLQVSPVTTLSACQLLLPADQLDRDLRAPTYNYASIAGVARLAPIEVILCFAGH